MTNVSLSNLSEFLKFEGLILESIVARRGKCLFPSPTFRITGLDPSHHYQMSLGFEQSKTTMAFVSNEWKPTEIDAQEYIEQAVQHEAGVMTGKSWMEKLIEFQHLRLTNCEDRRSASTLRINSRHKYIPVLKVSRVKLSSEGWVEVGSEPLKFSFEEASFVAVTKYVSEEVNALKTGLNKFASGKKPSEKRRLQQLEETQRKRRCGEDVSAGEPERQKQREPFAVQHYVPMQTINVLAQPIPPFETPVQSYLHPQANVQFVPQPHFIPVPTLFNPSQVVTQYPYASIAMNYPVPQLMGYPTMPQPQFTPPTFYQQYQPYF